MAWHRRPVLAQFGFGRVGNDWRCTRDARGENVHGDMAVGPQPRRLPGWSCSVELRARRQYCCCCYPSDGPSNRHGDAPGRAQSRSRTLSIRRTPWWLSSLSSRRGRRRGQSPAGDPRACPGKKSEGRGLGEEGRARNSAQSRSRPKTEQEQEQPRIKGRGSRDLLRCWQRREGRASQGAQRGRDKTSAMSRGFVENFVGLDPIGSNPISNCGCSAGPRQLGTGRSGLVQWRLVAVCRGLIGPRFKGSRKSSASVDVGSRQSWAEKFFAPLCAGFLTVHLCMPVTDRKHCSMQGVYRIIRVILTSYLQ